MFFRNPKLFIVRFVLTLILLGGALGATQVQAQSAVYRVTEAGASDPGCGGSWSNPCDLQYALTDLAAAGDEVWVAAGTYKPGIDRDAVFLMPEGISLYGGFAGTETSRAQRDPSVNVTVLSGDLNGDDSSNIAVDEPTRAENVFHVVASVYDASLDGFTITGGNANLDPGEHTSRGAGVWNGGGSPIFANLLFTGNSALELGGGMFVTTGSPILTYVKFENNTSAEDGGGLANYQGHPSLTNVEFRDNVAAHSGGGAVNLSGSHPTFTEVTFVGNSSAHSGGGMSNYDSDPYISKSTFYNNHALAMAEAGQGGGIYNSNSSPVIENTTFSGNTAEGGGSGVANLDSSPSFLNVTFTNNWDAIRNTASHPTIQNTIVWGNIYPGTGNVHTIFDDQESSSTISNSVIQNGYPGGTNIITTDPLFGALDYYGGSTQTISLLDGSSAIDQGNASDCPDTDQRGVTRPQGAACDIGAYEAESTVVPGTTTVRVLSTTGTPLAGKSVYAFDGSTYTGHSKVTDATGRAAIVLPEGDYRFRVDVDGTQFWSGAENHCHNCLSVIVTIPEPVLVTVLDTDGMLAAGLNVYAFNGATYTGFHGVTSQDGQVSLRLREGAYRFRADLNGTQFWSGASNHCDVPGCESAGVTVSKPVMVTILDTDGMPQADLKVYAFNGSTYTSYSGTTNSGGVAAFTLPLGSYRFRADLNGTQFWSEASNHCDVPGCESASVTVSKPVTVTVLDTDGAPRTSLNVYAFNGSTYTGYGKTTNADGQAIFTLPLGSYRFRADLNGTQFWSEASNHCDVPGCDNAGVTVSKPVTVTVLDTDEAPKAGLKVYAFNGTTYTGYSKTTNTDGLAIFTLPLGSYRFRADLNGTQFWSGASNHCEIPGCDSAQAIVTIPLTVLVQDGGGMPKPGVNVYAFNGSTYTGYSKVSDASGQAIFTLPLGSYRFRADYSGTQYWSGSTNHCSLPGCLNASVTVGPTISATTIIITASPNPSRVGEAIASTVTVSSASGTPEGTVTFSFDSTPITGCLDQPLTNGVFTCNIRFFMTGDLRVSFTPADGTAYSPAEAMEQHTVVAADVDVTVFDNPPISLPGAPVAVNARVRNIYDAGGVYIIPAGSVTFTNDEGDSCTDDLDASGYASCHLVFTVNSRYDAVYTSIDGLHNSGFGTGSHPVSIYTATLTNTPQPTQTATQIATPTFTPTFTPTVASTPVVGCNSIRDYFQSLPRTPSPLVVDLAGYTMSLDIPNPNDYPVEFNEIFVAWNGSSGHRVRPGRTEELRLMSVALNGTLWQMASPGQGGSSYTAQAPFLVPAVIGPNSSAALTFTFDKRYNNPNDQELVTLQFATPGCEAFTFTVTRY